MPPRRKPVRRKKKPAAPVAARPARSESSSYSDSLRSRSEGSEGSSSSPGNSDEDDPRDYKRGGYHPVMPYQLYNSRYRVLSKLGAGAFSTVWLCADEKDLQQTGPQLVAMKVCKSKKSVAEQARDEVLLLERLHDSGRESPHVVKMTDHFWHTGPNGRHKCMTFEVMGENMLALVKHYDYNGLPLPICRRLARHTLLGLEYIHSCGVLHTDVKLENVLIQRHDFPELIREAQRAHMAFMEQKSGLEQLSKSQKKRQKKKNKMAQNKEAKTNSDAEEEKPSAVSATNGNGTPEDGDQVAAAACGRPIPPVRQRERFDTMKPEQIFAKLADFGNGIRVNKPVTDDIQTRQYRSPEVIIGAKWDETADVWSAACMFFELATGDFLFDPRTGDDWDRDEDHLALIAELLGGLPPKEYALSGKYSKDFFLNSGKLKHIKNLKLWPLEEVLKEKYQFSKEDASEVSSFLMKMLAWEPANRQSASEALKHSWVQPLEGECDVPLTMSSLQVNADEVTVMASAAMQSETAQESVSSPEAAVPSSPATEDWTDPNVEAASGYPSGAINGNDQPPRAPQPEVTESEKEKAAESQLTAEKEAADGETDVLAEGQ
eukprot:CAMPEP_0197658630 /NCGR_PEP_ID=MMETSP1338-20131121/45347_1 /TAXON_ID=43686 ORGANISM="Pelagodinium beii, Strain RCC1491" /NCGR_SAMPLE_ID=MMETSP1338 /ASSEMBLY_ACC=CAM_ASM_000754 /LENGTH=603 /DNA_ID=CAMNT_0043235249 /DNA_START=68 /DNA_END=1876 /DNA_ORIENTATION=+